MRALFSAFYSKLIRWKYVLLTHKDYYKLLNRSVDVQDTLMAVAAGKRDALSREECKKLANKLGIPDEFQK